MSGFDEGLLLGILAVIAIACLLDIGRGYGRDRNVPIEFQKQYPCPSTGKTTGGCPGWERDHIVPLCQGGADTVQNMQWLTIEQHKLKTRGDCRRLPG